MISHARQVLHCLSGLEFCRRQRRITRIIAAIIVGMVSSLGWILLSADTFKDVYGLPAENALVPFSQPGIVTIPLGFVTLVVVSLMTKQKSAE